MFNCQINKIRHGHCHDERKKQHFTFEYKNPYQPKTLSEATIIAWDTNQTKSLMANNEIPPITKETLKTKYLAWKKKLTRQSE
jgi:hypothetical protein